MCSTHLGCDQAHVALTQFRIGVASNASFSLVNRVIKGGGGGGVNPTHPHLSRDQGYHTQHSFSPLTDSIGRHSPCYTYNNDLLALDACRPQMPNIMSSVH